MPYTIKPKTSAGYGSFAVRAGHTREALNIARGMIDRGIDEVEILDDNGTACDPSDLERIASKAEACLRHRQPASVSDA
jgi:hypothetical protein